MRTKRAAFCLALVFLAALLSVGRGDENQNPAGGAATTAPKNVILLIGDGMGISQLTLARLVGPGHDGNLAIDTMPVVGLVRTHSASGFVSDSAAAGTALATGAKTNNKMVSVSPDGKPLETCLEVAMKGGRAAGLVTTTTITHATPACFGSHVGERGDDADIAKQYVGNKIDVLLGGSGSAGNSLFDELSKAGWKTVKTREELLSADCDRLVGLFSKSHMSYEIDRASTTEPSLEEMTTTALKVLSKKPGGFFLMVEGGRIDHACHGMDAAAAVSDTLMFDRAVRACLEFAANDGNTLVVVTADHPTAGLTITERLAPDGFAKVKVSSEFMVELAKREKKKVAEVLESMSDMKLTPEEYDEVERAPGKYGKQNMLGMRMSERLGVTFIPISYYYGLMTGTAGGHDAAMVTVHASGPGAEKFAGMQDNTNIGKQLKALMSPK